MYHHSYLEEDIGKQEFFHLHLPLSHDVGHLVLHTWEEALEGRFIADNFEQWWGLFDEEAIRGRRENFYISFKFLEDKQHFGGEDYNIPKI